MNQAAVHELLSRAGHVRDNNRKHLSPDELCSRVTQLAKQLVTNNARVVGIDLPNGADWIAADLACAVAGVTCIPLPPFFTNAQRVHLASLTGMDHEVGSDGLRKLDVMPDVPADAAGRNAPAKITFTSGTTGTPKGVALSMQAQLRVAGSLTVVTRDLELRRHLCLLPLAVLLENVAGVYASMLSGAELILPPPSRSGLQGSSGFDAAALLDTLRQERPDSLILLPQMLKLLVAHLERSDSRVDGLRFVAVGGARTAPELLLKARAVGLPVFEGYGLSECASVVCLNHPGADLPGSVGKPLPHVQLRISPAGEIEVLLDPAGDADGRDKTATWLATGDLGEVDSNGFVHVQGRAKQILITSYGRNVSPEWIESELLGGSEIVQAMVVGDDQPGLAALVVTSPGVSNSALSHALERVNARLPDYARVGRFMRVEPFTPGNGQLTANGRLRREKILTAYAKVIDSLYRPSQEQTENTQQGGTQNHEFLSDTA